MPIQHTGKTIMFKDVDEESQDADKLRPSVRFHGNAKGGLVVRAWPRANSDGLIILSREDRHVLRDWLNEEAN